MKKIFLMAVVFSMGHSPQLKAMIDDSVLEELHGKMATLETTPHALDGEMPVLAHRLAEEFRRHYPSQPLVPYEDAKQKLLEMARQMGTAPLYNAGLQQPGETFEAVLQRRFNAIPPGPLLEATKTLLPIAFFLNQQSDSVDALIWSSVPLEGTTDSAYYGNLLRDGIAFLKYLPMPPEPVAEEPVAVVQAPPLP